MATKNTKNASKPAKNASKGKGKPSKPAKAKAARNVVSAVNAADRKAALAAAKETRIGATIKVAVPSQHRSNVGTPDGDKFGRTTGLKIVHFADAMFLANDKAEASDATLRATMLAEFPNRAVVQPIASWRAYHNAGKHGCGDGKHVAANYRDDGTIRGEETSPAPKGKGKGKPAKA